MSPRIRVLYQGKYYMLKELSESKGVNYTATRKKWNRSGRPRVVNDSLFVNESQNVPLPIMFNGEVYTSAQLSEKFNCSMCTISRIARKHGYILTDETLKIDRRSQAHTLAYLANKKKERKENFPDVSAEDMPGIYKLANKVLLDAVRIAVTPENVLQVNHELQNKRSAEKWLFSKKDSNREMWLAILGRDQTPSQEHIERNKDQIYKIIMKEEYDLRESAAHSDRPPQATSHPTFKAVDSGCRAGETLLLA